MATKKINYKAKAVTAAKALSRKRGYCEWCGVVPSLQENKKGQVRMKPQLQGAHILPEEYHQTCADPENILCLCASCHKFAKGSWHKSPMEAAEWFNDKFPGRYDRLKRKLKSARIEDWKRVYEWLSRD